MAEGPNLVVNGDFPVDVSGWTATIIGAGSFTWASPGKGLLSGATNPIYSPGVSIYVHQGITVTASTDYKAVFDIINAAGSVYTARVGVGTTTSGQEHGWVSASSTGLKTINFTTGAETTVYMTMMLVYADFSFASSDSYAVDNITLKAQLSAEFTPQIHLL